ncbi:hypothetical protein L226DRAFT_93913 [Lentinus tigrinus ALCF2SS1-7]|uniref:uncharacterized protein n=1 Tax=Lentinus tigrinus ALCF2SS1-7 TaxID=1328758 RepID=UPI001165E94F|nr:hypothetical protein L226DRAFT_93913 [Lentinus tigrinus ALCF2SS1-7]
MTCGERCARLRARMPRGLSLVSIPLPRPTDLLRCLSISSSNIKKTFFLAPPHHGAVRRVRRPLPPLPSTMLWVCGAGSHDQFWFSLSKSTRSQMGPISQFSGPILGPESRLSLMMNF